MVTFRIGLSLMLMVVLVAVMSARVESLVIQGPELEEFLRQAEIVGAKGIDTGKTAPTKLTMEHNGVTRYAVFKSIDDERAIMKFDDGRIDSNFRDSWRSEIAAYEIDKIMGLGMVPATVERTYKGKKGSVQFWVDTMMSEAEHMRQKIEAPDIEDWNQRMFKTRVFDNLVYNMDRNLNNLLITREWEIVLIDHSRAFRPFSFLKSPKILERFSRSMLEGMRRLNKENLTEKTGKYLPKNQIEGLLQRRDEILKLAEKMAAEMGEAVVYYP